MRRLLDVRTNFLGSRPMLGYVSTRALAMELLYRFINAIPPYYQKREKKEKRRRSERREEREKSRRRKKDINYIS